MDFISKLRYPRSVVYKDVCALPLHQYFYDAVKFCAMQNELIVT
jgi:hypothetical protein